MLSSTLIFCPSHGKAARAWGIGGDEIVNSKLRSQCAVEWHISSMWGGRTWITRLAAQGSASTGQNPKAWSPNQTPPAALVAARSDLSACASAMTILRKDTRVALCSSVCVSPSNTDVRKA